MYLIDTHLHLSSPEYKEDICDVIKRARSAGVRHMITIGSGYGVDNFEETIQISSRFNLFFALGVHPHEANLGVALKEEYNDRLESIFDRIRSESTNRYMVAIGEIGLDYYYNHSLQDIQRETFERFLYFAASLDMPVIIHSRDSFSDTIGIIRSVRHNITGVFHCFSGDLNQAKVLLDMGFFISIPGIVTFRKAQQMQEVARYIPDDRLLIETDAPFLAPIPYRGKRNEPAYILETYKFVSGLRNTNLEKLSELVLQNTLSCFKLKKELILDTN